MVTCPEEEQNIGEQCLAMVYGSESKPSLKQVQTTQSHPEDQNQTTIPDNVMATQETESRQVSDTLPQTDMVQEAKQDVVVYRVQIISNTKPVGTQNITVAGKTYNSFEYLYKGAYRTTIGEFSNLAEATRLQIICRQNGFSQAFVVAFKNNIRSTDPSLFR
jgi:ABC-type Fe3+-hydroxamate transport system substrate-binding protein